MILEKETFKKYGYYSQDLKTHPKKKIIAKCDNCGKIRELNNADYRDLCHLCASRKLLTGKNLSEETKKKIGDANRKTHRTEECRMKTRKAMTGKKHSEEAKKKMSDAHWQGGISFEPYCIKFNDEFKERVRGFWDRRCVLCDKTEAENKRRLDVHHVNYNKETCCDDSKPLFVPLCRSCHAKTNFNRESWKYYFTNLIDITKGGKSYYTKEEMD